MRRAGLVVLALCLTYVVATYFRRARLFLQSFDPPVAGRHVLLCAAETAPRVRDVLVELSVR